MNSDEMSTSDLSVSVAQIVNDCAAIGVMPTQGQTVADIGSDSGLVGFALIRHVADAMCISVGTADALDDARKLAAEVGVQDRATFLAADVRNLDLEADSIDVALFGDAVMALNDASVVAALANIRRAIRPGGAVFASGGSNPERSSAAFHALVTDAGFDAVDILPGGGVLLRRFALRAA
jgi:ubiquinone/menaquinone biosynthesis C-methylase UbiE